MPLQPRHIDLGGTGSTPSLFAPTEERLEMEGLSWGLSLELLVGHLRVYARAGILGQEPGVRISQKRRVEGPARANAGLHFVDETLLFPVVKDAIIVSTGLYGQTAIPLLAIAGLKFTGGDAQERGYRVPFLWLQEYTPFTITAFAAPLTVECLHAFSVPSMFSRFQSRRRKTFWLLSLVL